MEEIDQEAGIEIAMDALENGRLALICGAGLSMSPPSNIASAQALADRAREKYEAAHGADREPLPHGIDAQAAYFHARNQLGDYFLRTLIGPHAFSAAPNLAHYAVADLLLTRGADIAVSTNVDRLIETAGNYLNGQIESAIDRDEAATVPPDTTVLFKLHGCWDRDRDNTLWCVEQLNHPPLDLRIQQAAEWLEQRLLDRDLVVVGYFTHWEHLTAVLNRALEAVRPARLIIVDPAESAWLEEKAPEFYELGERAIRFCHVRVAGADFLDTLRNTFSRSFVRKILYAGRQAFEDSKGHPAQQDWLEPTDTTSSNLYMIRRDLEGCLPNAPAVLREPADEPVLGLTILEFRERGAWWSGSHLVLEGGAIRVYRAPYQPLHMLEAQFGSVTPPLVPETIVAVGAVDLPLLSNVARGRADNTITRGDGRRWITRETAVQEYAL